MFISLIINDVEHLFTDLLAIYTSSLVQYLSKSFIHCFNSVVFCLLLTFVSYLYILDESFITYSFQMLSLNLWHVFSFF